MAGGVMAVINADTAWSNVNYVLSLLPPAFPLLSSLSIFSIKLSFGNAMRANCLFSSVCIVAELISTAASHAQKWILYPVSCNWGAWLKKAILSRQL